MPDGKLEELQSLKVFQITDMLTQKGGIVLQQADRVLEHGTSSQDAGATARHENRPRDKTTAASDGTHSLSDIHDHGIVAAEVDIAIMEQKNICDGG